MSYAEFTEKMCGAHSQVTRIGTVRRFVISKENLILRKH